MQTKLVRDCHWLATFPVATLYSASSNVHYEVRPNRTRLTNLLVALIRRTAQPHIGTVFTLANSSKYLFNLWGRRDTDRAPRNSRELTPCSQCR
jgi:hypothetical protein